MSGTEERDDWLDAFDLDELEDPALPEVDAAAERIGTALGSGPTRSWLVPTALVAVAAGVLLGVGVGVGVWLGGRPLDVVGLETVPATIIEEPEAGPDDRRPEDREPVAEVEAVEPDPAPDVEESPRVERPPSALPGLIEHAGTAVVVADGEAVLSRGLLTYVHDATHEPGVGTVAWAGLPVRARPLGTVFVAAAGVDVAVLRVSDGEVALEHRDGRVLSSLSPGDELTVLAAPDVASGVRLLPTGAFSVDEVAELIDDPAASREAVSLVTRLRLAALNAGGTP